MKNDQQNITPEDCLKLAKEFEKTLRKLEAEKAKLILAGTITADEAKNLTLENIGNVCRSNQ